MRVALDRGGIEILAGDEHHDIVGGQRQQRFPIFLVGQLLHMGAQLLRVPAQMRLARLVLQRLNRIEIGGQRRLGVDDDAPVAGHPDHELAKRQMRGFSSMLAFDMKGGLPAARRLCDRVRLFLMAASLGGAESLVILPIYSSHYDMSDEELKRAGVGPGTVRVSLGLEDKEDLIEDLKQALE